jgi:hypothetical protein
MTKKSTEQLAVDIQKLLKQREAEAVALKKLLASLVEVGRTKPIDENSDNSKKTTK